MFVKNNFAFSSQLYWLYMRKGLTPPPHPCYQSHIHLPSWREPCHYNHNNLNSYAFQRLPTLPSSSREPCTQPYLHSPEGNPVPNPSFTLKKGTLYPTLTSPSRREPCTQPFLHPPEGNPTLTSPSWMEPFTQP